MLEAIKNLPKEVKQFYTDVYNKSLSRTNDALLSAQVALDITKKHLSSIPHPELYSFSMDPVNDMLITNSADGEIVLNAVLATTEPRKTDGKYFTEVELQEMADQINAQGSTLPDANHETLNKLRQELGPRPGVERILGAIREQKGIFRKIQAAVKEGKLWIQAFLDKRYKNHVSQYKGLSIEAMATADGSGRLHNPRYMGFTFTSNPELSGAQIAQ